jgi:hypothetical protein
MRKIASFVVPLLLASSAWANPPLGPSIQPNGPGNTPINMVLPVQLNTAAGSACTTSCVYGATDLYYKTRRSNSGTAMTDTLPPSIAVGMVSGARIDIADVDTVATDTLTAGSGTAIASGCTVAQPGQGLSLVLDTSGGTPTWRGVDNTCAFGSGAVLNNISVTNPTGTTSTGGVMMGIGADTAGSGAHPCTLTPKYSTRIHASISGNINNSNAAGNSSAALQYGTGTAPANGAANTGTRVTGYNQANMAAANQWITFNAEADITGLTVGTAVWFDLLVISDNTGHTASVENLTCALHEF